MVPEDWYQRYGQRASDYRLPQAKAARAALAVTVGADGFALLDAVHAADAPAWLRQVPSVQTMRVVWIQQYYRDGQGLRWRGKGEVPPAALAIDSPYVWTLTLFPGAALTLFPRVWPSDGVLLGLLLGCHVGAAGSLVGPVAGAVHEDLVAGVDQPVQQGLGDDRVGEQRVPVNG